jgi:hypothetical protein
MKRTLLLLIAGIAVGAVIAKKNDKHAQVDSVDLIIEKSNQTMRQASAVSARADKAVSSKMVEMKQAITVLEQEKKVLVEQVKVMENAIDSIKSTPAAEPFNVLAIVPDSAR